MFVKIPFSATIDFKSNISEITKMSLEHDFNVNDGVVLGNFYISGEYKAHAVSINKEPFKYTLPFTVELRDDIVKDTLEFNIEDFSYDIVDKTSLKVNIEYSLTAEVKEKKEELFERVDENELENELEFIDEFLETEKLPEPVPVEEKEDEREDIVKEELQNVKEDIKEEVKEEPQEEERLTEAEEKTIMDTIKTSDDTFVTYHIHIVKENETMESIASIYSVPASIISEYNNIDNLTVGDKVLIPKCDE